MSRVYTVKEVAAMLKCNVNRVYDLIDAGVLPAIKIGALKIREEALEEFLTAYEGKNISDPTEITNLND